MILTLLARYIIEFAVLGQCFSCNQPHDVECKEWDRRVDERPRAAIFHKATDKRLSLFIHTASQCSRPVPAVASPLCRVCLTLPRVNRAPGGVCEGREYALCKTILLTSLHFARRDTSRGNLTPRISKRFFLCG